MTAFFDHNKSLEVPGGSQGPTGDLRDVPGGSKGRARGSQQRPQGSQGRAQGIHGIPGGSRDVPGIPWILFIKMNL